MNKFHAGFLQLQYYQFILKDHFVILSLAHFKSLSCLTCDFKLKATLALEHFSAALDPLVFYFYLYFFIYLFFFLGRILNRFSKDIGMIDDMMPMILCDVLQVSQLLTSNMRDLQNGLWILSNTDVLLMIYEMNHM